MPSKLQIACNLTHEEAQILDEYAKSLELSRPKLCALLVMRELHLRRLEELKPRYSGSEARKGAARVTARIASAKVKSEFVSAATACGLGLDDAAAVLFRAELEERWLLKALQA